MSTVNGLMSQHLTTEKLEVTRDRGIYISNSLGETQVKVRK
jgi:hypothetical protein